MGTLNMDELIAMQDRVPNPFANDPVGMYGATPKKKKTAAPPPPEEVKEPVAALKEPCPAGSIEIGQFYFPVKVTWQISSHPLGCYALAVAGVQVVADRPTHKNGVRIPTAQYERVFNSYREKFWTEDNEQDLFYRTYGLTGAAGQSLTPLLTHGQRDLFKRAFKLGMDKSWNQWIAQMGTCGMVLFGDVTTSGVSNYTTGWLAWYLQQRGEGVLSCTHGVVNPNYPTKPRVCQVWAWTSPMRAEFTTATGLSVNALKRDVKSLQSSIQTVWKSNATLNVEEELCPLPTEMELNQVSSV